MPIFCLFKSSFTPSEDSAILCELFGQSFANRFLQNRDFFSTHRNSIPYTRGTLTCLLGFWPSGPKPCGGKKYDLTNVKIFQKNGFFHPEMILRPLFCFKDIRDTGLLIFNSLKQKKLIVNFVVIRNWKKLTDSRKKGQNFSR